MISVVLELLVDLVVSPILDAGLEWQSESRGKRGSSGWRHGLGYFVLGALVGVISLVWLSERVFGSSPLPRGASLVLTPLVLGLGMHAWGRMRVHLGHHPSGLGSFVGGAAFGFGAALARLVWFL